MASEIVNIFAAGDYAAQVSRGARILQEGGLVVLPTETAYGVAGLLSHPTARKRLIELRGDAGRPFTLHVANPKDADAYVGDVGDYGRRVMRKLWPGPVGLVFDVPEQRRSEAAKAAGVDEADLYDREGAVALRCPKHIVFGDVVRQVKGPIGMTLAGAHASGPGWSAADLAAELGSKAELIFDAGPSDYAKPSTLLKISNGRYSIVRPGIFDERMIDRLLRTTILFVCSGNTCRSPMAEALARSILAKKLSVSESELDKKGITVMSAGSFAMPGSRATPQAVEAVRQLGSDLSHHRSRPLTVELIHQADQVFTMSRNHAAAALALAPSASDKVTTLDPDGDIEDPIGGNVGVYQDLAGYLQVLIERRFVEMAIP